MTSICTALSLLGTGALPSGFPAGWNGEAATPPLAFRTWNAFYAAIDASLVTASIDAMVGTACSPRRSSALVLVPGYGLH